MLIECLATFEAECSEVAITGFSGLDHLGLPMVAVKARVLHLGITAGYSAFATVKLARHATTPPRL